MTSFHLHVTPPQGNKPTAAFSLEFIIATYCSAAAMAAEYRVVNRITEDISPTTVKNISGLTLDMIMHLFAAPLSELQAWIVLH